MRQVILDTETTGLQTELGHRIIEVGCVELFNRKFTGKTFHYYFNPEREVEEGALAVHGITNEFLKDKPLFKAIAPQLIEFISGAEIIIHNAPFDTAFINHELNLTNQNWKTLQEYCRIFDTLVLARQMHAGQRNSLDALCKRYSVDNSNRDLHGALLDAHLLAQVYLAMTGGQGSLFEVTPSEEKKSFTKVITEETQKVLRNLPVLMANSDELVEHEKWLQKMKEKGNCIWS